MFALDPHTILSNNEKGHLLYLLFPVIAPPSVIKTLKANKYLPVARFKRTKTSIIPSVYNQVDLLFCLLGLLKSLFLYCAFLDSHTLLSKYFFHFIYMHFDSCLHLLLLHHVKLQCLV